MTRKEQIAEQLLNIDAVVLRPESPFTWSSGLKSPVYCDNRLTMSYPEVRREIAKGFIDVIKERYPDVDVIAGTATAGIPHAAWVSAALDLPMVYVRGSAKSHGKKKQIEGLVKPGQKVVVIEDLISTGGSVLTAVEALRESGAEILGAVAIFTYQLAMAAKNLEEADVAWETLTDFESLIDIARYKKIVTESQLDQLKKWLQDPENEEWLREKDAGRRI